MLSSFSLCCFPILSWSWYTRSLLLLLPVFISILNYCIKLFFLIWHFLYSGSIVVLFLSSHFFPLSKIFRSFLMNYTVRLSFFSTAVFLYFSLSFIFSTLYIRKELIRSLVFVIVWEEIFLKILLTLSITPFTWWWIALFRLTCLTSKVLAMLTISVCTVYYFHHVLPCIVAYQHFLQSLFHFCFFSSTIASKSV